jgi:IS30 family transposase
LEQISGIIVTHADKASKFLLAGPAKNKTVQQINQVTLKLFEQMEQWFRKRITFDNGKAFSGHQTWLKHLSYCVALRLPTIPGREA